MGCEFILVVFEEIGLRSFPLMKTGVELHFATAVTMSAGSYLMLRGLVIYGTCLRIVSHEPTYLPLRAGNRALYAAVCVLLTRRDGFRRAINNQSTTRWVVL